MANLSPLTVRTIPPLLPHIACVGLISALRQSYVVVVFVVRTSTSFLLPFPPALPYSYALGFDIRIDRRSFA